MKKLIPTAAFAALLAAILLLSGCGGKAKDPAESLEQAARRAREAGSVHAQINVALAPLEGEAGMALNAQGDAWLDMDSRLMEARFTAMGMEFSLRYVEGKAYIQFGGKWYVLSGEVMAGLGEGSVASAVNALSSYPDLLSSTAEVSRQGEKTVGNNKCDDLKVTLDYPAMVALEPVQQLADGMGMTPSEIEEYLRDANLEVEAYVQQDEPVIRRVFLSLDTELPDMGKVMGISLLPARAHVEVTIDVVEYGIAVDVQAPPNPTPFKGL
jgi:hypothetical protein